MPWWTPSDALSNVQHWQHFRLGHVTPPCLADDVSEGSSTRLDFGRPPDLVEPWISPFSHFVYRYLHQEECDLSARPWDANGNEVASGKRAFEGNQAIPYLLFGPERLVQTLATLSEMKAVAIEPFCLFAYLLSFGFKPMNLLPVFLYPLVSKLEQRTLPLWRSVAALRVVVVLEKMSQDLVTSLNQEHS